MLDESYKEYFKEIKSKYKIGTEITLRTAFENFLNAIKSRSSILIINEAKKTEGELGKPDFKIEEHGLIIGYVETKPPGTNLNEIIYPNKTTRETEQLKKYLSVTNNLILTNYTEFVHIRNGEPLPNQLMFSDTAKDLKEKDIKNIADLFSGFFLFSPKTVDDPKKLSNLLATRAILFRDALMQFIENEKKGVEFKERLVGENGLYMVFKDTLIEDLSQKDFLDSYVQTITYGLFLSRLNSRGQIINRKNAFDFIPKTLGVIRELFKTTEIADIPKEIEWIIEEMITLLNHTNVDELQKKLSFNKRTDYEDPYVYFYENFLLEYDKKKKIESGVFYTPIPVVWFIIKSVNEILKKEFKKSGLKDSSVTALDFATGTGTFLLEAFKNSIEDSETGLKRHLVKEHLLKDFYGFEFQVTPYTIAHLKLSQFLSEYGYVIENDDRVQVYLTDSLDDQRHKTWALFPILSKEGIEANKIKLEKPILVVMGNPPYSIHSKNKSDWITGLIRDYKEGLNERKINLDDDYIKFLRFGQWKIDKYGQGVLGVITNNSFLDGAGHRVMRKKLLDTFDKMYICNLHGDAKRDPDKNVFDIRQGVAISLFVKLPKSLKEKEVFYFSSLENDLITRDDKYSFLLNNDIASVKWSKITPSSPEYWFVKRSEYGKVKYEKYWNLKDIFGVFGSGVKSDRDELFIDTDSKKLVDRMKVLFSANYSSDFKEKYVRDSSSYKITERLKNEHFEPANIQKINYRLFDERNMYYKVGITSRPGFNITKNFAVKDNIGLIFCRQVVGDSWQHAFITDKMNDICFISLKTRETNYVAPLYLIDARKDAKQTKLDETSLPDPYDLYPNKPNFTEDFIQFISEKYPSTPSPEEILSYIYAILYSPTYRKRYHVFLKSDFPRIPFTTDVKVFKRIAKLGSELISLHLLRVNPPRIENFAKFSGDDRSVIVDKPLYEEKSQRLHLNKDQYFQNVPKSVWEFEIGGYTVLSKWLSDRKGKKLTYDDITHLQKVMQVIIETTKIMKQIDSIIPL